MRSALAPAPAEWSQAEHAAAVDSRRLTRSPRGESSACHSQRSSRARPRRNREADEALLKQTGRRRSDQDPVQWQRATQHSPRFPCGSARPDRVGTRRLVAPPARLFADRRSSPERVLRKCRSRRRRERSATQVDPTERCANERIHRQQLARSPKIDDSRREREPSEPSYSCSSMHDCPATPKETLLKISAWTGARMSAIEAVVLTGAQPCLIVKL